MPGWEIINDEEKKLWFNEVEKVSLYLRGDIIPETIYDAVITLTRD